MHQTVKIEAKTDTTRYVSDLTGGFICNIDPIIPGSGIQSASGPKIAMPSG